MHKYNNQDHSMMTALLAAQNDNAKSVIVHEVRGEWNYKQAFLQ
jgi:hypothetical protein